MGVASSSLPPSNLCVQAPAGPLTCVHSGLKSISGDLLFSLCISCFILKLLSSCFSLALFPVFVWFPLLLWRAAPPPLVPPVSRYLCVFNQFLCQLLAILSVSVPPCDDSLCLFDLSSSCFFSFVFWTPQPYFTAHLYTCPQVNRSNSVSSDRVWYLNLGSHLILDVVPCCIQLFVCMLCSDSFLGK